MSEELKGTNIYAPIVPGTDEDKYPTHHSIYGKGDSNVYVPRRKETLSRWTGSKSRLCVMSLMMTCSMYGMEACGI